MESIRKEGKKKKDEKRKTLMIKAAQRNAYEFYTPYCIYVIMPDVEQSRRNSISAKFFGNRCTFFKSRVMQNRETLKAFFFFVNRVSLICRMRLQFCSVATYM